MIHLISAVVFGAMASIWDREGWANIGIFLAISACGLINLAAAWPWLVSVIGGAA